MRTAITRAVEELAKEQGWKWEPTTHLGGGGWLNEHLRVTENPRQLYDDRFEWTWNIPPFTPKADIKTRIRQHFKSLKSFDKAPQPPLPLDNQQKLL